MASRNLAELLRCLVRGNVECILVLLVTRLGPLDALGALDNETYAELLDHSSPMELGEGRTILVLELSKLIELKRIAGRPKDLAVLPVLEATLELTRK